MSKMSKRAQLPKIDLSRGEIKKVVRFFENGHIGWDIDGTLSDFSRLVVREFNRRLGTNYFPYQIKHWDALARWARKHGMSEEDALALDYELWTNSDYARGARPIEATRALHYLLHKEGFKQSKITAREPQFKEITAEWFNFWMPWVSPRDIHVRQGPQTGGEEFKISKIRELGITHFFEDYPVLVEKIMEATSCNLVCISPLRHSFAKTKNARLTTIIGRHRLSLRDLYEELVQRL